MKQEQDPYFETRDKEDAFSDRIVKSVEEKVLSNLPALIGNYVMCIQQIPFQNGSVVGQPAGVNSTGIFPTTTVAGAINPSRVEVEIGSDDLSKESYFEIEENEFLDFGMME
jgi:hypothetical protein